MIDFLSIGLRIGFQGENVCVRVWDDQQGQERDAMCEGISLEKQHFKIILRFPVPQRILTLHNITKVPNH